MHRLGKLFNLLLSTAIVLAAVRCSCMASATTTAGKACCHAAPCHSQPEKGHISTPCPHCTGGLIVDQPTHGVAGLDLAYIAVLPPSLELTPVLVQPLAVHVAGEPPPLPSPTLLSLAIGLNV